MTELPHGSGVVARLPLEALEEGEIAPPMEPAHRSWQILDPWNDPLAPWAGYRVPSGKRRITHAGQPAIEWAESPDLERALVSGQQTWRE